MPHNLDSLEWITNKTRRSSLSQEINKKQTNLIPINGQSSSAPGWKLLLVAAAKLLVFKIDIEVPAKRLHESDPQCIVISYSPCKFLVVGDPIFGLRGLFPIGFVALQSTVDDVYSCAKALKSKDFGKKAKFIFVAHPLESSCLSMQGNHKPKIRFLSKKLSIDLGIL